VGSSRFFSTDAQTVPATFVSLISPPDASPRRENPLLRRHFIFSELPKNAVDLGQAFNLPICAYAHIFQREERRATFPPSPHPVARQSLALSFSADWNLLMCTYAHIRASPFVRGVSRIKVSRGLPGQDFNFAISFACLRFRVLGGLTALLRCGFSAGIQHQIFFTCRGRVCWRESYDRWADCAQLVEMGAPAAAVEFYQPGTINYVLAHTAAFGATGSCTYFLRLSLHCRSIFNILHE
jgi:hypothetical protein